ncbi:hypothetical protein ACIHFC_36450 [Streptomyces sp. NPDC052013]|uniref:hypothetical protein n=1 Tax=Streptomyces sp. NPDC052013 TaxID=3365679 RepID=UPI0037CDC33D
MEQDGETRGRGPAPALLVRHMEKIAATLPRNRFGVRDLSRMTMRFSQRMISLLLGHEGGCGQA